MVCKCLPIWTALILKRCLLGNLCSKQLTNRMFYSSALLYLIFWICLDCVSGYSRNDGEELCVCMLLVASCQCLLFFYFLLSVKAWCPEAECCSVVQSNPSITQTGLRLSPSFFILPSFLRPKYNRKGSSTGVLIHRIISQNTGML